MSDPRAFIVVITAAVLLYAAITDLQEFRTRNELILCLIMLWLVHVAADHEWTSLYRDIGFAALLFIFMLYFYARSWMGGGDVKLATVAFLWTGADRALVFAILLLGFAAIHTAVAKLGWVAVRHTPSSSVRIPFAPSIAGALIGVFVLGWLRGTT
jgi:prepilin peptidase CpaA